MTRLLRLVARRLPPAARRAVDRAATYPRLRRAARPVRWGNLRRLEPVSARWGRERGTPVDRHYIDDFFARRSDLIRGRVLEVRDPRYAGAHGSAVTSIDIVDIDPRNDDATIIADLAESGSLPREQFDCAIVAQTLVYTRDPVAALSNVWQSLKPSGALLLTVPAIARLDPDAPHEDRWHLTPAGVEEVIGRACVGGDNTVEAYGNPVTAVAFLHGLAAEELRPEELQSRHPLFPIVVMAAVVKPA